VCGTTVAHTLGEPDDMTGSALYGEIKPCDVC